MKERLTTRVVSPDHLSEALAFALAELSPNEATAIQQELLAGQAAGRGQILLIETTIDEKRSGAMAAWLLPGKSATVWAPHVTVDDRGATLCALSHRLEQELRSVGTRHAQALLPADALAPASTLAACHFEWVADLLYLVCEAEHFPKTPPRLPFRLVPRAGEQLETLITLVEATYEETLDCPALNGLRPTREVLMGYHATGEYRPDWWYLVEQSGELIGCLILADYSQAAQVELVYFGLVPAARGQGFGEELVRAAQFVAHEAHRERVVLAVDARNRPAIEAYLRTGFSEWGRRAVWLRTFGERFPPSL